MKILMLKTYLESVGFEVSECRRVEAKTSMGDLCGLLGISGEQSPMMQQMDYHTRYRVAAIFEQKVFILLEPWELGNWEMVAFDDHSADFILKSGLLDVDGIELFNWTPYPEKKFLALLDCWGFTSEIRGF